MSSSNEYPVYIGYVPFWEYGLLNKSALKARGWTASLMNKFLPTLKVIAIGDQKIPTRAGRDRLRYGSIEYYAGEDIYQIEQSAAFRERFEAGLKRRRQQDFKEKTRRWRIRQEGYPSIEIQERRANAFGVLRSKGLVVTEGHIPFNGQVDVAAILTRDTTLTTQQDPIELTKQLLSQRLSIDEVAERRRLSRGTIMGHIDQMVQAGENIDLRPYLPSAQRMKRIQDALKQSDSNSLVPVKEALGDDYDYGELRIVRAYLRQAPPS